MWILVLVPAWVWGWFRAGSGMVYGGEILAQVLGWQVVSGGSGVGSSPDGSGNFGAGFWGVQEFRCGGFLN